MSNGPKNFVQRTVLVTIYAGRGPRGSGMGSYFEKILWKLEAISTSDSRSNGRRQTNCRLRIGIDPRGNLDYGRSQQYGFPRYRYMERICEFEDGIKF